MLPQIEIRGQSFSRLIVGGNPVSGNSHVNRQLDRDMEDYFTAENVKKMLFRCEENGINALQMRGDKHIMRLIREYRQEGGRMSWIAQTASEMGSFAAKVRQIVSYQPAAIYHHGTATDNLFLKGQTQELIERLKIIRETGLAVGLCTHMPRVVEFAEEQRLDVDFYMCCVYNISVPERRQKAEMVGSEEPLFVDEDVPIMYETIRSVEKPCLAFKILGATRRCQSQETVRAAFDEAYSSIKPTDAVIVGMYPKTIDQVGLNCQYAKEAIEKAALHSCSQAAKKLLGQGKGK